MRTVEFLAPAQAEFAEAVDFYDSQQPGLGSLFAAEVERTIDRIVRYPEAWPPLSERTCRCLTHKFPYGIIYRMRGDVVLIVAVMHLRREPQAWRRRLRRDA